MAKDTHFVSLIIPTIGRETLARTKAALQSQTRPPDELIIINDHSRRGPAWARNQGIMQAKGDLLAFTDDDCVPPEDWLEKMVAAMDAYNADMVNSHYHESDPFLREIKVHRKFPTHVRINPDKFISNAGNVIYRRTCLEECMKQDGYIFNPVFSFYASEDADLSYRLRLNGCKLVFIDNHILHLKQMTLARYFRFQFTRGIGIAILYEEHKNRKQGIVPDQSLLWNNGKNRFPAARWLVMVWEKILGPFDRKSFSSMKHFWIFWMGEKFKAVGFVYAVIYKYKKLKQRRGNLDET